MSNHSILEILGPVMIGPSSSHTAGAVRLGQLARGINGKPFSRVLVGLHGSFAKTYRGHGTDKALIAGLMGFAPDDERIRDSLAIAKTKGLAYSFTEIELEDMHPNTARIVFYNDDHSSLEVTGSSIGGGQVLIQKIDETPLSFTGSYPTLIIDHIDRRGIISEITTLLARYAINIATMHVSRTQKNKNAILMIEADQEFPEVLKKDLNEVRDIHAVRILNLKEAPHVSQC
ncbi:MAG: serine dehydratase [delta proteobacterium ML8_F1]|nr:MAG: serine dehydratase [delta proteobacterium ML8_F1]